MTTGTTFYVITPTPPATLLVDGDHYVLIPHADGEYHARLEVKNCTGDYPIVRWRDREHGFVPVGDDFLIEDVPTGLVWNADMASFVVDAQAVNIHGYEWLKVGGSTVVDRGSARLLFDIGIQNVTCDLTTARQFSDLIIHNASRGIINIRAASIGSVVKIYRAGVLLTTDVPVGPGQTVQLASFEPDEYTLFIVAETAMPPGSLTPSPANHDQLLNVTPNQHHSQTHAHDGTDGSGTVAHGDTTGQGEDDHHPKTHTHDSHTGIGEDDHHPKTHEHSSHTGIGENDHHPKAHTHDGVDGSGTVAHAATTGKGEDDHHAKTHAHDSHTGIGEDDHHPKTHAHSSHTGLGDNDHPQYLTVVDGGDKYSVFTHVAANYTIQFPNECVLVDSSVGSIVITLPPTPALNAYVGVWDAGNAADVNSIGILQNGNTIVGLDDYAEIDRRGGRFDFIWDGSTWEFGFVLGCAGMPVPVDPAFKFVVTTDDVSFDLPLTEFLYDGTTPAVYDFEIDWGDGTAVDHITAWNQAAASHSYFGQTGDFTVTITGTMEMFNFYLSTSVDADMVTEFLNWGTVGLKEFLYMFYECGYMSYSAKDAPVLDTGASGAYSLYEMFYGAGEHSGNAALGDFSGWDVSTITEFDYMFSYSSYSPVGIGLWDVSAAESFGDMFSNNPNFNRTIGGWDVGNCTYFGYMFDGADAFNQDLSAWQPTKSDSFSSFLNTSAFSTANYDLLLNAWSLLTYVETSQSFGTYAQYTIATSQAARDILTGPPNSWSPFTDGGGI